MNTTKPLVGHYLIKDFTYEYLSGEVDLYYLNIERIADDFASSEYIETLLRKCHEIKEDDIKEVNDFLLMRGIFFNGDRITNRSEEYERAYDIVWKHLNRENNCILEKPIYEELPCFKNIFDLDRIIRNGNLHIDSLFDEYQGDTDFLRDIYKLVWNFEEHKKLLSNVNLAIEHHPKTLKVKHELKNEFHRFMES